MILCGGKKSTVKSLRGLLSYFERDGLGFGTTRTNSLEISWICLIKPIQVRIYREKLSLRVRVVLHTCNCMKVYLFDISYSFSQKQKPVYPIFLDCIDFKSALSGKSIYGMLHFKSFVKHFKVDG